jgi:hypothetical protein
MPISAGGLQGLVSGGREAGWQGRKEATTQENRVWKAKKQNAPKVGD